MKFLDKISQPQHPELFTDDELENYTRKSKLSLGKFALGPTGIAILASGAITENIPASIVGVVMASYGLLSGSGDTLTLSNIQREINARPQAEALPLEFTEDK